LCFLPKGKMDVYSYDYSLYNYTDFAIDEYFSDLIAVARHNRNVAREELEEKMRVYNRKINKIILRSSKQQKIKYNAPHIKARRY
jgi:hypothetical protein